MKTATVKMSTLQTTGRWDAKHNIAVVELLKANGLDENENNVLLAHPLAKAGVSHVEVGTRGIDCELFSLHWEKDGARFHVWVDADHKITKDFRGSPVLYKNPPLHTERNQPGYFQTRRLDANKHGELIIAILHYAEIAGLFDAAIQREKDAQNRRLAEIAAERAVAHVKEAGPQLLTACKEALLFLTAPDHSATGLRTSPVARANLARILTDAIEAAEPKEKSNV